MTLGQFQSATQGISMTIAQANAAVSGFLSGAITSASQVASSVAGTIGSAISGAVGKASDYFYKADQKAGGHIYDAVTSTETLVNDAIADVKKWVDGQLEELGLAQVKDAEDIKKLLIEGLKGSSDTYVKAVETTNAWIESQLDEIGETIGGVSEDVYKWISPKLDWMEEQIKEIPISIEHFISALTGQLIEGVKVLANLPSLIREEFEELLTFDETKLEEYTEKMMKLQERVQKKWQEKQK